MKLITQTQLTPDPTVRDEDKVVLGLVISGAHVVDLGVHADLRAAVKYLQEDRVQLTSGPSVFCRLLVLCSMKGRIHLRCPQNIRIF